MCFSSVTECETLVKDVYTKMGLVYKDSSSEDEGGGGGTQSSEVIEIDDDDDDDVIAVGCGMYPLSCSLLIALQYSNIDSKKKRIRRIKPLFENLYKIK